MRRILPVAAMVLFLSTNSRAVDLKPTPVQSQFQASLARSGQLSFETDRGDAFIADNDTTAQPRTGKSVGRAVLYSVLLPGLGQYYTGHKTTARYFFGVELATWLAYGGFRMYGGWKKADYIEYGDVHAGAQLEGKSNEFLDWVGFYSDINEFNSAGRVGDRDRPYLVDTPENHWHWQSVAEQQVFRDLKNMSRESYRRANFMIGVAVLNRVVSAITAAFEARRARSSEGVEWSVGGTRFELNLNPTGASRQCALTFYPGF